MKKLIFALISLIILGSGIGYYVYAYGGQDYYTQIISEGQEISENGPKGQVYKDYEYKQAAFDETGTEKATVFRGNKERPLKKEAYLKLKVNRKYGVISWSEVTAKEVPAAPLAKLKAVK